MKRLSPKITWKTNSIFWMRCEKQTELKQCTSCIQSEPFWWLEQVLKNERMFLFHKCFVKSKCRNHPRAESKISTFYLLGETFFLQESETRNNKNVNKITCKSMLSELLPLLQIARERAIHEQQKETIPKIGRQATQLQKPYNNDKMNNNNEWTNERARKKYIINNVKRTTTTKRSAIYLEVLHKI